MQTKHEEVCEILWRIGKLFNKHQMPDDEAIETYASVLVKYKPEEIVLAITSLVEKGIKFFPSCPEIIAEMKPQISTEDQAQLMTDKIWNAILSAGLYNQKRLAEDLEPLELNIARSVGVATILNSDNSEASYLKTQLRKSCLANLNKNIALTKQELIKSITGNNELKILDFTTIIKIENEEYHECK